MLQIQGVESHLGLGKVIKSPSKRFQSIVQRMCRTVVSPLGIHLMIKEMFQSDTCKVFTSWCWDVLVCPVFWLHAIKVSPKFAL
jgi:hypothetical protein